MDLSERAVRAIEQRAIEKLKRHPRVRAIWKEFTESRLSVTDDSAAGALTSEEAAALLRLAQTAFERRVLRKILALERCQPGTLPPDKLVEGGGDGPLDLIWLGRQEKGSICPRIASPLDELALGQ